MIGVASVILVGSAIDGLGLYADESTAKTFGSESFVLAAGRPTRSSRGSYFDKLKYNREFKLADERYLELINSDNTLYSAYRNSTIDTKRGRPDIRGYDDHRGRRRLGRYPGHGDGGGPVLQHGRKNKTRRYVAVIGDDLKNNLFPGRRVADGQDVQDSGSRFHRRRRSGAARFGIRRSQDNAGVHPDHALQQAFRARQIDRDFWPRQDLRAA